MALEDSITALIVAIQENTATVERSIAARAEAVEVVKQQVNGAAAEKPKKASKAAEAPAPEPETPAETPKPEAPAADPYEGLKDLIAAYFAVNRPEEREARREKVMNLPRHDKIRKPEVPATAAPATSNIAIDSIPLFKKQMAMLVEKGDLTVPAAEDDIF